MLNWTNIIAALLILLFLSIVVETLVNILKGMLPEKVRDFIPANVWSVLLGLVICIGFRIDLFAPLGMVTQWEILPMILTGILSAGGSALIYELLRKVRELRKNIELNTEVLQQELHERNTEEE